MLLRLGEITIRTEGNFLHARPDRAFDIIGLFCPVVLDLGRGLIEVISTGE